MTPLPSSRRVAFAWDGYCGEAHKAFLCLLAHSQNSRLVALHNTPLLPVIPTTSMCLTHIPSQNASDPVSRNWESLITGFFKSGKPFQALSLYQQMQQQDSLYPSPYTLVCLLKVCAQLKDHLIGRTLHMHIARMSMLHSDPFLGSTLIDMYAKSGFLPQAQQVFDKLPVRNVVIWTTLISAYVEHGRGDLAIFHLETMQKNGVFPDDVTYICGLKACSIIGASYKGQELHAEAIMKGLEKNPLLCTTLVDMYAKCRCLPSAQLVFDKLPVPNEFACTALIVGYTECGLAQEALQNFQLMQSEGIPADAVTYACSLKACGSVGAIKEGCKLHIQVTKQGLETDLLVCNTLIDMYAKSGALLEARLVLLKLPFRNVVSWNALIAGYVEHEHGFEVVFCFKHMQDEGIIPDDATLSCTLKACGMTGNMQEGQEIHAELVRSRLEIDMLVGNALVNMYAKCGLMDKAWEVFESLPVHDVVSWTALITGYAEYGSYEEALYMFFGMLSEGVSPDATTFLCTLKACSGLAALDTGREIHAEIIKKRIKVDPVIGSSLVGMYAHCGWLEKAQEVFNKIPSQNVPLYNALLTGYAQIGEVEKVFGTIRTMITEGLPLNVATFATLFNACSYAGLLDEGQAHLAALSKNFEILPTLAHYNCMVDLLCRADMVDRAVALIQIIPFHPSAVVWHDILGACQRCRDVELGMQAFYHALGLNERDSAVHISMMNIFFVENYKQGL